MTLDHLGDTYHALNDGPAACDAWQQALAIFDMLIYLDAEQIRAKLAGI